MMKDVTICLAGVYDAATKLCILHGCNGLLYNFAIVFRI